MMLFSFSPSFHWWSAGVWTDPSRWPGPEGDPPTSSWWWCILGEHSVAGRNLHTLEEAGPRPALGGLAPAEKCWLRFQPLSDTLKTMKCFYFNDVDVLSIQFWSFFENKMLCLKLKDTFCLDLSVFPDTFLSQNTLQQLLSTYWVFSKYLVWI